MEQAWYRNAIFYSLDVETFSDSNADGIGDFPGLVDKMDFLAGLGVNCIWLLPFYPSSNKDNGYDVTDYYNVDPRFGSLGDFSHFLYKAEQLGIRVIIDLVINHTSHEHPWFLEARENKNSIYRDFYVWSDEPLKYEKEHLVFKGEENTIWTFDERAGQYYLHRFYKEQPDLNITNKNVREEILKIMGFWLRLGVDGFRVDAAQMLVEPYGLRGADRERLLLFIDEMHGFVKSQRKDAMLLAEVNAGPGEMQDFMQDGERMHMLFNFFVNQHLFLSLAQKKSAPVESALQKLPLLDKTEQRLNFLRHHDELNLQLLKKEEQQEVFSAFAPEENMRIFGHGIRRRLAPMMNADEPRLRLAYSLLFSLPGVPMIRYGDEIGMGDDLSLEGRSAVRTPMQWTSGNNAGFSRASSDQLVHPVVSEGEFGFEKINVQTLQQKAGTILNWIEQLISTRKQCPEIGYGKLSVIPCTEEAVLIHSFQWQDREIFFLHNFSGVSFDMARKGISGKKLYDVFGDDNKTEEPGHIHLPPYGYKWFRAE